MARSLVHINDVTPDLAGWAVKVLVEAKGVPRQSSHGLVRSQNFALIDVTGTRIIAEVFDMDIDRFEKIISLYNTYLVSKAKVCLSDPSGQCLGNKFTWIFSHETVITRVDHDVVPRSIIVPQFQKIGSLQPLKNGKTVDIVAILIKRFPPQNVGSSSGNCVMNEFVLFGQQKNSIILALWNDVAAFEGQLLMLETKIMPVIAATTLVVSQKYGMSLQSTPLTSIVVDPFIPEADELRKWRTENQKDIKEALLHLDRTLKKRQRFIQTAVKLHTISDVKQTDDVDAFSLNVGVQVSTFRQRFFYVACGKCNASFAAEVNWTLDCNKCDKKTIAIPREVVSINIFDETGCLEAVAFGENAVRIINMNAVMAMGMYNAGHLASVEQMNSALKDKKYIVKLKKNITFRIGLHKIQYLILKIIEAGKEDMNAHLSSTLQSCNEAANCSYTNSTGSGKSLLPLDDDRAVQLADSEKKLKKLKNILSVGKNDLHTTPKSHA